MTTITIDRAVVEQALEALETYRQMMFAEAGCRWDGGDAAITALRAALAQEQADRFCDNNCTWADHAPGCVRAQQAEPAQQPADAHTTTLRALLEHCLSWEPAACVLGNVTAQDAITALRTALAQEQAAPDTCTWQQEGYVESSTYRTSCGHYFDLEDGTPADNEMAHCCFCGKKLVQELITEDDDE